MSSVRIYQILVGLEKYLNLHLVPERGDLRERAFSVAAKTAHTVLSYSSNASAKYPKFKVQFHS